MSNCNPLFQCTSDLPIALHKFWYRPISFKCVEILWLVAFRKYAISASTSIPMGGRGERAITLVDIVMYL